MTVFPSGETEATQLRNCKALRRNVPPWVFQFCGTSALNATSCGSMNLAQRCTMGTAATGVEAAGAGSGGGAIAWACERETCAVLAIAANRQAAHALPLGLLVVMAVSSL